MSIGVMLLDAAHGQRPVSTLATWSPESTQLAIWKRMNGRTRYGYLETTSPRRGCASTAEPAVSSIARSEAENRERSAGLGEEPPPAPPPVVASSRDISAAVSILPSDSDLCSFDSSRFDAGLGGSLGGSLVGSLGGSLGRPAEVNRLVDFNLLNFSRLTAWPTWPSI